MFNIDSSPRTMVATKSTKFILARAATLLVDAYKQLITEYQKVMPLDLAVGNDAPDTYEKLWKDARWGVLKVSTEFNKTSIYGASGNLTFRIMHDYGHLLYNKQFTTSEEVELACMQWQDLRKYIPNEWVGVCHAAYMADTVNQSQYEAHHNAFPQDQKDFVACHLQDYLNTL